MILKYCLTLTYNKHILQRCDLWSLASMTARELLLYSNFSITYMFVFVMS